MSGEANKALVNRFVDAFWNNRDMAAIGDLMATNATIHAPEVGGTEGLIAFNHVIHAAFPDWHSTPEELIAEGEYVVERWTGRGTQRGEFQGIPPTGRRVEVPGVVFYRIVDDKIVEFRGSFDMLRLLQQLGALPESAATPS